MHQSNSDRFALAQTIKEFNRLFIEQTRSRRLHDQARRSIDQQIG